MQPMLSFPIKNQIDTSSNDDLIDLCDGYRYIDGCYASYDVGFNFLSDGTIDIVHFLDIDGNEVIPDMFDRDYVERKLILMLCEESVLESYYD